MKNSLCEALICQTTHNKLSELRDKDFNLIYTFLPLKEENLYITTSI